MTKRIDELVQTICGAPDHPLAPFLREWCAASRAFVAFAEAHATKIRKKVRLARQGDEFNDVFAELAVAAFVAHDRRFAVRYEPYHASGERGPDFEVVFKAGASFHIEVTRLRLADSPHNERASAALKLARVVCGKIEQLPPGAANLLVAIVPPGVANDTLAPVAIHLLNSYPSQGADALPQMRLEDVRAFLRQRGRLSAISIMSLAAGGQPQSLSLWRNPQAKHSLHPDVAKYFTNVSPT